MMETFCDHKFLELLRIRLGFGLKLVVDCVGKSGGLCLFRYEGIDVSLLSYSHYHIDTLVVSGNDKKWRLTGFYGNPVGDQRIHGWTLLKRLASMFCWSWIVGGDFNEILY